MYIPKPFLVEDQEEIYDFIENNSFGIIVSKDESSLVATHLPFSVDRINGNLYGHFARANTQWGGILDQEVLVIFQGPHTYISPSWYETNISVPTWNYVAVHVYGYLELIGDPEEVLQSLETMRKKYEKVDTTYLIDESNNDFIQGLMKGIVGFKININRLEGKWKLSQNHSKERQEKVIHNLEQLDDDHAKHIAKLMNNNLKK